MMNRDFSFATSQKIVQSPQMPKKKILSRAKTKKRRAPRQTAKTEVVQRFTPGDEEARDEGPRLIPLSPMRFEHPKVEHYLALADSALLGRSAAGSSKDKRLP